MRPSELEALLRARLDPSAEIKDMTDNGGYGLVRWSRPIVVVGGEPPLMGREHIVHRWAIRDTEGIERWPEGHFYSGGYYEDEGFARSDYLSRSDTGPRARDYDRELGS